MQAIHLILPVRLTIGAALCFWLTATPGVAQTASTVTFSIVQRGVAIGSEQVSVERSPEGMTISSSGRIGPPVDIQLRTLRIRYTADGRPLEMAVDASARQQATVLRTVVTGTAVTTTLTPAAGEPVSNTGTIDPAAVLLPNPFVAPYEAVSLRVMTAAPGSLLSLYQPGGDGLTAQVGESTERRIQTLNRTIAVRQTRLTLTIPGMAPVDAEVWGDETGRLLRFRVPSQSLEFVRDDVGSVSSRLVTMSRPNDEDVRIPANGFSLAGTLSKPAAAASGALPVVLLLSGSSQTDRDETIAGIPLFGQLAHVLADSGVLVLRYDKRGVGQSGGRADAATLADYAEDAKAVVQFLRSRKDVDRRRVFVAGHGEGGWVALLTAAGNDRVSAVGLLSTVAVNGADFNLYQVRRGMERAGRADADREAALTLQRQIQEAVISGRGWDGVAVTPQVRRQADTPYFQSFLTFDPAKLIARIDQPILVLEGALDRQLPPGNAEQFEMAAKARKKAPGITVAMIPGVNHLLVPAVTGELDEYGTLADRTVSGRATVALSEWVAKIATVR